MFRFVADGNTESTCQSFCRCCQQHIFNGSPRRSEIVERTLVGRLTQRIILLPEKRQNKAIALHKHTLLLGQRIGKHGVLIFVHHTGSSVKSCLLNIFSVLCHRRYESGNILLSSHHNKFKLTQMVIGRSFKCSRQYLLQYFVRNFFIRKIPDSSSFL